MSWAWLSHWTELSRFICGFMCPFVLYVMSQRAQIWRVSCFAIHTGNIFPTQFGLFLYERNQFGWGTLLQRGSSVVLYFEPLYWRSSSCGAAAAAKSLQSCPTLCDPVDGSPPGSPVPWILQARTLECVAISFSNAWKWKVKVKLLSHVWLSDPMDCSLPGSSIHGVFQVRVLEWGAIAFSVLWSKHIQIGMSSFVLLLLLFSC